MRILITGGAGFIGHYLIEHLLLNTEHIEIVCLDRLDTSGCYARIEPFLKDQRLKIVWHDLKAEINDFVSDQIGNIDIIMHLAAGSHVDRSISNPMEFVMDNVVGTCNLLNYARKKVRKGSLKLFLYFSTDEVFGNAPDGTFYDEWDRYNSGNPYSASKAGAEELCLAFSNTYKIPMAITHTMNVIGIRQHKEKFLPLCIRRSLLGEKVFIHAYPNGKRAGSRHYVDVKDVADAVLFITSKYLEGELEFCDKYNIVGSEEIDNLELYQMIHREVSTREVILPQNYELVDFHSERAGHDLRYALSGKKLENLGWKPNSLRDVLGDIVEFYMKNREWIGLEDKNE